MTRPSPPRRRPQWWNVALVLLGAAFVLAFSAEWALAGGPGNLWLLAFVGTAAAQRALLRLRARALRKKAVRVKGAHLDSRP